ncbi:MAG: cytochrome C, partial [Candidatus Poribacteria bacterium]
GDWHKKSAKKDPDSCVTCHKRKFCFNCHEIEMPHPTDWANNHKKPATKEKDICNNCHKPKYCAECH